MSRSQSFSHFDFSDVLSEDEGEDEDTRVESAPSMGDNPKTKSCSAFIDQQLEDSCSLRRRTSMLGEMLQGVEDEVLCLITHKAWLRELERGPFGREMATEFETGEIRVYAVTVEPDGVTHAELLFSKGGQEPQAASKPVAKNLSTEKLQNLSTEKLQEASCGPSNSLFVGA